MTQHSQMQQPLTEVRMPASQAIFKKMLLASTVMTVTLAAVAALVGFLVAGQLGLISALLGAVIGGVFMMLSALSIVIANRQIGNPLYVQIFFATVLGALLLKMVLFLMIVFIVRDATWVEPQIVFIALIAGVILSLALDLFVLLRNKIPAASDVQLHE